MKRIIFIFILVSLIGINSAVAFAVQNGEGQSSAEQRQAETDTTINVILPQGVVRGGQGDTSLPTADLAKGIVPQAIKLALGLIGTVVFGVFVYAGVMLLIAQGNEEEITKFKNIIIWSLVGLLFITTAYALVSGIMQLMFK